MQSLSVQALALRQLGRLNSLQLLSPCHGSGLIMWCPQTLHARQLWGSATPQTHRTAMWPKSWDARQSWLLHQTRLKSTRKKGKQKRIVIMRTSFKMTQACQKTSKTMKKLSRLYVSICF
ncbi:hypothetical protein PO909_019547 [Leuciscus waleckii]